MLQQEQNLGRRFGTSIMHLSGFGCCPFFGAGSVVVDSLLIVTPIVGFCNCFMFCCVLPCVQFCNHLHGGERACCFALFVFLVSSGYYVVLLMNVYLHYMYFFFSCFKTSHH